jgi:formamidase
MSRTKGWFAVLPLLLLTLASVDPAFAKTVKITRTGPRCADDANCHNRWHHAIKPVATADPGDLVVFETRDALDGAFNAQSRPADVASANLNLVHPLTGPLFVNGAEAGDVLAVTLVDIAPDPFGFTVIVPGFGFLRDLFPNPAITRWDLNRLEGTSPDMPGVRIPFFGFMGTVGVAPGPTEVERWYLREAQLAAAKGVALPPEPTDARPPDVCGPNGSHKDRCLRTIPPRENGGNMDIKQMQKGTILLLPCFVRGCLLSVGDVHYAQGDGEVSGTAIECPVERAQLTFELSDLELRSPIARSDGAWVAFGFDEDLDLAAEQCMATMLDLMERELEVDRNHALALASVAVDLAVTQVVNGAKGVHAVLRDDAFR